MAVKVRAADVTAMDQTASAPLSENEHIKELLSILQQGDGDTGDLAALLG